MRRAETVKFVSLASDGGKDCPAAADICKRDGFETLFHVNIKWVNAPKNERVFG